MTAALGQIQSTLDNCIPLAQRLNSLLPEEQRLERLEPVRLPPRHDTREARAEEEEEEEDEEEDDEEEEWEENSRTLPPFQ